MNDWEDRARTHANACGLVLDHSDADIATLRKIAITNGWLIDDSDDDIDEDRGVREPSPPYPHGPGGTAVLELPHKGAT